MLSLIRYANCISLLSKDYLNLLHIFTLPASYSIKYTYTGATAVNTCLGKGKLDWARQ